MSKFISIVETLTDLPLDHYEDVNFEIVSLREDGYSVKQNKAGRIFICDEDDMLILTYPDFYAFKADVQRDRAKYEKDNNIQYELGTTADRPCNNWPKQSLIEKLKNRPHIGIELLMVSWVIAVLIGIVIIYNS